MEGLCPTKNERTLRNMHAGIWMNILPTISIKKSLHFKLKSTN